MNEREFETETERGRKSWRERESGRKRQEKREKGRDSWRG